jgi:hypothetical protein
VTATADTSKKQSATVTVPDLEIFEGAEQTLYADETESAEITFNAPGDWTAAATDESTGEAPTWITLALGGAAGSLAVNHTSAMSFKATSDTAISGPAGNNSITIMLQPNTSGVDRTAIIIITITATNTQVSVTITQRYITEDEDDDAVLVSISPLVDSVLLGESRTFEVTTLNTDYTLSASAEAGCAKNGNTVTCTPTAAGEYGIIVTATADTTKMSIAILWVIDTSMISISPPSAIVLLGGSRTFEVTARNTDYTLSVSPESGAGCVKNDYTVICTPTEAGTYNVTVTADTYTTKTATATLLATQDGSGPALIEKASIKYHTYYGGTGSYYGSREETLIITFDNFGMRVRRDTINLDIQHRRALIADHIAETNLYGFSINNISGSWSSWPYSGASILMPLGEANAHNGISRIANSNETVASLKDRKSVV